ncbi:class I tRNA ligase family protein, partial [Staphylococcus hominis]|uniref:class I tRNA ligase family protein n=1 Tax=Staphylococcus hominis TaxID=1290 RepID=UPI0037095E34
INLQLTNFYLHYPKHILYIQQKHPHKPPTIQTLLYQILLHITKLLPPILLHTAQQLCSHTPHLKQQTLHLPHIPKLLHLHQHLLHKSNQFISLPHHLNPPLEAPRNQKLIRKSLQPKLLIPNNHHFKPPQFLQQFN